MTSNINFASIDADYPIAGQDNDSQGFRDNFSSIKTSLQYAKDEIEELQAKAVLKGQLDNGPAVDNNLGGENVYNGSFNDFFGKSLGSQLDTPGETSTEIDVAANSSYVFTINSNINFLFKNWPGTTSNKKFASVRIHLLTTSGVTKNATFYSENGGLFFCEPNVTTIVPNPEQPSIIQPQIAVSANGKHKVIEVWSVTDGSKLYVRYLGEY